MTELSFLIELLLNHDLPKATKDLIASRIKEVEAKLVPQVMQVSWDGRQTPWNTTQIPLSAQARQLQEQMPNQAPSTHLIPSHNQAPSTLALMAKHGDIQALPPIVQSQPEPPVEHIAQTPATAAAMQARQASINAAIRGGVDKTAGKPRKW